MSKPINWALKERNFVRYSRVDGSGGTSDLSHLSLFKSCKGKDGRKEEHQPCKEILEARHGGGNSIT